jgi:cytoskeletal protein CcmA (bactofilin family)
LKDVSKLISEQATRFLPVDMKNRLKSAFNRNTANNGPGNPPVIDEDVPDYSAIFNANKSPNTQKKPRYDGSLVDAPIEQPPLAESASTASVKPQIIHDIEEAVIVTEPVSAPAPRPEWEAASLKPRKADRTGDALISRDRKSAEPPNDVPDYSAIFKSSKPKTTEVKPPRPQPDAASFDRVTQKPTILTTSALPKAEDTKLAASAEMNDETLEFEEVVPQKPKARFFNEFNSTESVRLKVEKRSDERSTEESKPTPWFGAGTVPHDPTPESNPVEVSERIPDKPLTTGVAYLEKAYEQEGDAYRGATQTVAIRPVSSEPVKINFQKENAAMDAKGHESENGATAKTEGAAISIERNSKFSGQLKVSGAIAIDGQVEGELSAERIVVHEGGVVNATVEGNTVVIAGTVKGDIYARNELEILPSGVVHGSVTAPAISVRRGGRVEGRCAIGVPRQ